MARRKTHPATVEPRPVRNGALDLEVKRFYVPGCTLKSKCPKCATDYERDCGDEYFSYPPINKPFEETLYCQNNDCEQEWDVTLMISLVLAALSEGGEST